MLPIFGFYASNASQRAGVILREIATRSDRVPVAERVDLPEIQESFRVSFSNEARVQPASPPDRQPTRTDGLGPTGIDAYRRIAGY
ncbi:MAG: hypothetical protein HGA71_10765 [Azonexaceae bacterium]|nr:hypothetical protein [Azonexaceae bacterium]